MFICLFIIYLFIYLFIIIIIIIIINHCYYYYYYTDLQSWHEDFPYCIPNCNTFRKSVYWIHMGWNSWTLPYFRVFFFFFFFGEMAFGRQVR